MVAKKDSPNRRRSIAVPDQNKPSFITKSRRRAYSIVPGDRLSPLAKARRSLAPRKSILKSFTNVLPKTTDESMPQSQSQGDDGNYTQSMDITNDLYGRSQDSTTRKSLGSRRVSFAANVQVRFINKGQKSNGTNSQPSDPAETEHTSASQLDASITDENDYPGAKSNARRRSSVRYSIGSEGEDMDLTSVGPVAFLQERHLAANGEEEEYDDMDVTEILHGDLIRRQSLALGRRQSLAYGNTRSDEDDSVENSSYVEGNSQSDFDSEQSEAMEFTIPLNESLRTPPHKDAAWLALRQATHSGDTPYDPEPSSDDENNIGGAEMQLDAAMERLVRARESLSSHSIGGEEQGTHQDDTFSSVEESVDANGDDNQTINVSKVFGMPGDQESLKDLNMDNTEMTMDESEIYGSIVPPTQSTPKADTSSTTERDAASPNPRQSSVFQPPPRSSAGPSGPAPRKVTIPVPFSFTARPQSPATPRIQNSGRVSPVKSKPTFSAAFAPPVTRPSPKKPQSTSQENNKRAHPGKSKEHDNDSEPNRPSKRPTIGDKLSSSPSEVSRPLNQGEMLSMGMPSKSPSFQHPSSSLRRPSGYFARRKSLAVAPVQSHEDELRSNVNPSSKKSVVGSAGRASLGSVPAAPWQGLQKNVELLNLQDENTAEFPVKPTTIPESNNLPPPSAQPTLSMSTTTEDVNLSISEPTIGVPSVIVTDVSAQAEAVAEATAQWRDAVEQQSEFLDEDVPPISIEQFFAMTGIKFMDEITAPRRSTHPAGLTSRQARNLDEISLAEFAIAMGLDIPQLVLYSRVSKDLQAWIGKSKADFVQAEDEAAKMTPELFTEYSKADEEGQAELLHQLQLIRTNTRGLARSDWYDWKIQWLEGLRVTAENTFNKLQADSKVLDDLSEVVDDILPALQREYQNIVQELERENAEVAEIEACDQNYLNELKASIAEQNIEVEALQAEVAEAKAQLVWVNERLEELDAQKTEAKSAIIDAQRIMHIQKNSTSAEVLRLKEELEALEDLHMFRAMKVDANIFEYTYASQIRVSVPCKDFKPIAAKINVTRIDKTRSKFKDDFPRLSTFLVDAANQYIRSNPDATARQVVHRLSDFWSSCTQLRSQLKLLAVKYPVEILISESTSFRAQVPVLYPSHKAKASVAFIFSSETFSRWPVSIRSLQCEVEVAYGPIEPSPIQKAITERLSQATPGDNYACLLDACIEAQDIYS